jgi:hypothetical protein
MPRIHRVPRGTGRPKDRDEVNRREVFEWTGYCESIRVMHPTKGLEKKTFSNPKCNARIEITIGTKRARERKRQRNFVCVRKRESAPKEESDEHLHTHQQKATHIVYLGLAWHGCRVFGR